MRVARSDYSPEELLTRPLAEVGAILRQNRERRSGLDRRLGSERRRLSPGNPKEQINLRLFGERRGGVPDRRGGVDRRSLAESAPPRPASLGANPCEGRASPDPRRFGVRTGPDRWTVL